MWHVRASLVILVSFFACFLSVLSYGEVTSAEDYFLKGKQLVEDNSGDNMSATKEGLEAGIKALEKTLEIGYLNIKEVYKLLGNAYFEIADKRNPAEFESYMQKRKKVYDILLKIAPDDPDVLKRYADSYVKDKSQQIEMYRRIIKLNPQQTDARFVLGLLLVETGSVNEGVGKVGEAIAEVHDRFYFSAVRNYVGGIVEALSLQGCPLAGGAAMRKKAFSIERAWNSSTSEEATKQAIEDMANFKKEIAKRLAKHKCLAKKK